MGIERQNVEPSASCATLTYIGGHETILRIGLAAGIALAAIGGCGEKAVLAAESPDRKDVRLTIYKEDFAMVSEVRRLALAQGRNSLAIKDVSAALDPRSSNRNLRICGRP